MSKNDLSTKFHSNSNGYKTAKTSVSGENRRHFVKDDEYYTQLQEENRLYTQRKNDKPENPQPPVNVVSKKSVKRTFSVYDEIAQRRRNNRRKNNDKKAEQKLTDNIPLTEKETEEFINTLAKLTEQNNAENESQDYGAEEIGTYFRHKNHKVMWIILICSLVLLSILAIGMYLYVGGYMEQWIG